jgi:hypothetical protein
VSGSNEFQYFPSAPHCSCEWNLHGKKKLKKTVHQEVYSSSKFYSLDKQIIPQPGRTNHG